MAGACWLINSSLRAFIDSPGWLARSGRTPAWPVEHLAFLFPDVVLEVLLHDLELCCPGLIVAWSIFLTLSWSSFSKAKSVHTLTKRKRSSGSRTTLTVSVI